MGRPGVILHCGAAHTLSVIAFDQILGLRERGWQIHAACEPEGWEQRLRDNGIPIWPIALPYRAGTVDGLRGLADLIRILGGRHVALVHTHNAHHGVAGRIGARLRGAPSVHTWRYNPLDATPSGLKRTAYGALEAVAARAGDAVLFQNREDLRFATRSRIVPASRALLVGNGIRIEDHERPAQSRETVRRALGITPSETVVTCVARLVERKRQADLLSAAARPPLRGRLKVLLVGSGPDEAALRAHAARQGVADATIFAGEVTDVTSVLWASDIFCLPSRREGVPRAVMEAMACRLPVIATDVVGTRELVVHDVTGLLVPFGQPPALADALRRLLDRPDERAELARRAYDHVVRHWHQNRPVERTSAIYERLLGIRPAADGGSAADTAGLSTAA